MGKLKTVFTVCTMTLLWLVAIGYTATLDSLDDGNGIIIEMPDGTEDSTDSVTTVSNEIEKMPQLIEFVKADYPADLVKQGIAGNVLLELLVNESGHVDSVSVVTGIHPVLDSNAVIAGRSFRFTPALIGDDTVAVLLQYEYRFTIDDAIDSIVPVVNLKGMFLERGTRQPIQDAMVVITFLDSADQSLPLPFAHYIKKIGAI